MLEDGLSYPTRGENALGKNLLGGLLVAVWFLIVPALAYYGYLVRVLRDTVAGREDPPAWEDWGALIVDGLKLVGIAIVYWLVPVAIALSTVLLGGLMIRAAGNPGAGVLTGIGLLGVLVFLVAALAFLYVLPAAITHFAVTDRLGGAFEVETLGRIVTSREYAIAWFIPIVIYSAVSVLQFILLFTIIGLVVVPWITFYASVVVFQIFGQAYREALQDEPERDLAPDAGG